MHLIWNASMSSDTVLTGLRRYWRSRVVLGCAALMLIGVLAAQVAGAPAGLGWAAAALGLWLYQGVFVGRRLTLNHRPGEVALLTDFGPGTITTLVRGWLLACLAGFLVLPRPLGLLAWVPALLYTFADAADYLDGYLARRSGRSTRMGEALDVEYDALGLLIAVSVAVHFSSLPFWYLPVGLARYAFILGLWLRHRAGKPIQPLPHSDSRRPLAGLQMGALAVILTPVLRPPVTTLGGVLLAIPLLIGFTRDWLVVSGVVDPNSEGYRTVRQRVKGVMLGWSPVLLRAALVATAFGLGSGEMMPFAQVTAGLGLSSALRLGEFATAAAVGLAVAPRISAGLYLALLLQRAAGGATEPRLLIGVAMAVGVLMVGGGALSAWQPEVRWFGRRAGENGAGR